MTKKCIGCGSTLQSEITNKPGYIKKEKYKDSDYCERCFKIINYGECDIVNEIKNFNKIIDKINESDGTVVYLVDLLNITKEEIDYISKFKKNVIVLLTKKDVLPKSVKEKKLISYFKDNYFNKEDILCISSFKKYNIDKFLDLLDKKNIKKIFVVGFTNVGKSTFINSLVSAKNGKPVITTSAVPNTTSDFINIEIGNLTICDTPGFVSENSIYNFLKLKDVIKLMPKKEIKVKTYQIKPDESIIVDNILRIDHIGNKTNSFSFYMNNNLPFERIKIKTNEKLKMLPKKNIHIKGNEDVVINGLGFIKIVKETDIVVYTLDEKLISVRNKMI